MILPGSSPQLECLPVTPRDVQALYGFFISFPCPSSPPWSPGSLKTTVSCIKLPDTDWARVLPAGFWCVEHIYTVFSVVTLCTCSFVPSCFGRFSFQIISFGLLILISTCQRKMVNKAHSSQQEQEQQSEWGEQQSWQLCFSALSTVGKSIPRQPCCHLWSFWSRRVIYRNLFAQSQYLPVSAVKICNPSLLLPCCFSCQ